MSRRGCRYIIKRKFGRSADSMGEFTDICRTRNINRVLMAGTHVCCGEDTYRPRLMLIGVVPYEDNPAKVSLEIEPGREYNGLRASELALNKFAADTLDFLNRYAGMEQVNSR